MDEVLILIDIQNMYFSEGTLKLHEPEKAAEILDKFRKENKPIINVKHMFKVNGYENGDYLLDFNGAVKPEKREIIISKNYPNSFLKTKLYEKL